MPINILMPALSPTMEKGNLAKWLKKEGEKVKPGDVIAEIETDKATMEVEAVDEGVLAKIVVPEGTHDVPVNQLIAVLAGEGEDVKAAAASREGPCCAKAVGGCGGGRSARGGLETPASEDPLTSSRGGRASARAKGEGAGNGSWHEPHLRLAAGAPAGQGAGIDLARIQGSGPHGRVIARDVEAANGQGAAVAPGRAPARRRRRPSRRRPTTRSARCSSPAAMRSCRTTTSARSSPGGWSRRSRPSRISI